MLECLALALAVGFGAPFVPIAVLTLAIFQPIPSLGLIATHAVVRSGRSPIDSPAALFCSAIADELRAGASTRAAIIAAAQSLHVPGISEDDLVVPVEDVARALGGAFPEVGPEISVCISRSWQRGAPAADLFDEVAELAMVEAELQHEVRTAMAPARITSAILVAAPAVAVTVVVASGDVSRYLQTPAQRVAVVAGLLMVLGSFVVGGSMIRKAG